MFKYLLECFLGFRKFLSHNISLCLTIIVSHNISLCLTTASQRGDQVPAAPRMEDQRAAGGVRGLQTIEETEPHS